MFKTSIEKNYAGNLATSLKSFPWVLVLNKIFYVYSLTANNSCLLVNIQTKLHKDEFEPRWFGVGCKRSATVPQQQQQLPIDQ